MAKPTLLQTLLGRPSQTYSFPHEKAYYSTKRDMVRIATETHGNPSPSRADVVPPPPGSAAALYSNKARFRSVQNSNVDNEKKRPVIAEEKPKDEPDPRSDSDSDSDHDVFYTPNASPRTSMASSTSVQPSSSKPPSPIRIKSTTTTLPNSCPSSSSTSISTTSLDANSLFSLSMSDSTRVTTPVQSDSGHHTGSTASSSVSAGHPKHRAAPHLPVNKHIGQDWSKDVRWLSPPDSVSTTTLSSSASSASRKRRPAAKDPENADGSAIPKPRPSPASPSQTRTKPHSPIAKSISKATPSIMSSMTVLMEEDEQGRNLRVQGHAPRSSVLISTPSASFNDYGRMSHTRATSVSSKTISEQPRLYHRRSRSLGHSSSPRLPPPSHASSSSFFYHGAPSATYASTLSHRGSKYASSSTDPFHPTTSSLPTFNLGDIPSNGTPGYTSLVLPRAPIPFAQASVPNKRASLYFSSSPGVGIDGKVDLTRSGIAQTTMATVEVVRGLSGGSSLSGGGANGHFNGSSPSRKILGLFKKNGGSSLHAASAASPASRPSRGPESMFGEKAVSEDRLRSKSDSAAAGVSGNVLSESDVPLGFTSYRKPPSHVPSESVLVQVWAVGIDGVDYKLVFGAAHGSAGAGREKSANGTLHSLTTTPTNTTTSTDNTSPTTPKRSLSLRSTLGRFGGMQIPSPEHTPQVAAGVRHIPGRSFVGRVLECGWEVDETELKRGEWVVGLLDLKKSGALAEFVVVDRHRVHRIPHPRMHPDPVSSVSSTPSSQTLTATPPLQPSPNTNNAAAGPSRSPSVRSATRSSASSPSTSSIRTANRDPYAEDHSSTPTYLLRKTVHADVNEVRRQHLAPLTVDEMALLPACGVPAYRAMRTLVFAFSNVREEEAWEEQDFDSVDAVGPTYGQVMGWRRKTQQHVTREESRNGASRRVLVLRGHDGAGAMAVQMLVRRGWRVCVHAPYSCLRHEIAADSEGGERDEEDRDRYAAGMRAIEDRVRAWGGEEVIFDDGEDVEWDDGRGAAVRAIERLCAEGEAFDAVLDTIGGKEIREASERLLQSTATALAEDKGGKSQRKDGKSTRSGGGSGGGRASVKQFTTLVGDCPWRTIPTAGDHFRAGLRAFNFGLSSSSASSSAFASASGSATAYSKQKLPEVGYAWVSAAQDVDWEGDNVRESLGAVLRMAVEEDVKPFVGCSTSGVARVVPFERAPRALAGPGDGRRPRLGTPLVDGGTVVVKVVS